MAELDKDTKDVTDASEAENDSEAEKEEAGKPDTAKADKAGSLKAAKKPRQKGKVKERILRFLRDYKSELKKIVWYGRKQTMRSTALVVVVIVVSALFISLLDIAFAKLLLALGSII